MVRLSNLIVTALKMHSKAKRDFRRGISTLDEFNDELKRILFLLGEVTGVHGDSAELDDAKSCIWFTIEMYNKDKEIWNMMKIIRILLFK